MCGPVGGCELWRGGREVIIHERGSQVFVCLLPTIAHNRIPLHVMYSRVRRCRHSSLDWDTIRLKETSLGVGGEGGEGGEGNLFSVEGLMIKSIVPVPQRLSTYQHRSFHYED